MTEGENGMYVVTGTHRCKIVQNHKDRGCQITAPGTNQRKSISEPRKVRGSSGDGRLTSDVTEV